MGTEILRPQDCLNERLRFNPSSSFSTRRKNFIGNYSNSISNQKSCRKQALQQPRKRSPPSPPPSQSQPLISTVVDEFKPAKNFSLGQVSILKRGESLDLKQKPKSFSGDLKKSFSGDLQSLETKKKKNENLKKTFSGDLLLLGTERLGPDPHQVPIRLNELKPLNFRSNVYAGSAFALSPSPRALPLPKFSIKKEEGMPTVDDSATKDLRRLLRID
ncbi:Proline-rich nuclear receptor coactivator [Thalictrum thalictroides]|uniref:Proline-rich nuclear receptor coactivator n=1 Tax=Thalictrum thalictroides TaxID=46969 RepID=A0A7J6XFR2_THATH|nr:Proline-rich nuclear receptor coactivator [Thalictrum thalictroides]